MAKKRESEIIDEMIIVAEEIMKKLDKHLLKTETLREMCEHHPEVDIEDEDDMRERFLNSGLQQAMQSRLYAHNYFSVYDGYFVNVDTCQNIAYLKMILQSKDDVLLDKVGKRNEIKKKVNEMLSYNGQMRLVPDEDNILSIIETKTMNEVIADLEADAI